MTAALRRVSVDEFRQAPDHDDRYFADGFADADRYLDRFDGSLDFAGKSILDVGCGYGSLCLRAVERGARRAVGIDMEPKFTAFAQDKLASEYAHMADRVEFHLVDPSGWDSDERFDIVLSKDSFEHIADPESYVEDMKRHLEPGGLLAIGFGPLWRSPYGAHQRWMTALPWAHLLFPERVVMAEWRRLGFPDGAERYEEISGGLNKMTLSRFLSITDDPELQPLFRQVNQTTSRAGKVLETVRRLPGVGELCAFNVYAVWRYAPRISA